MKTGMHNDNNTQYFMLENSKIASVRICVSVFFIMKIYLSVFGVENCESETLSVCERMRRKFTANKDFHSVLLLHIRYDVERKMREFNDKFSN